MDDHKDLEIVERCRRGEGGAFEAIILKYQNVIMSLAYRIVRNNEDARDVAQAVFIKAFGSLDSFDPRHKFFSWLYRIAVNESLNFVDRRNRRATLVPDWTAAAPDPEEKLALSELNGKIDKALRRLQPAQRALLALSVDGFSYREIGRILDLSENKVKSKLFSARNKLREFLGQDGWPAHE